MERLTGTLDLLHRAYAARLTVSREGTTLHIAGPRSAVAIVRELQAAKPDVMPLVDYLAGDAAALDWRASVLALQERPCVLCGNSTRLLSPYDGSPAHKTCVEARLDDIRAAAAATSRRTA